MTDQPRHAYDPELDYWRERAEKAEARVAELEAGGCSRDQGTTQFCQEAVAAVARAEKAEAEVNRLRSTLSEILKAPLFISTADDVWLANKINAALAGGSDD